MQSELTKQITDYLDYLRDKLQLQVSFCNICGSFDAFMHELQPYNAHYNTYCTCVKTNSDAQRICTRRQVQAMDAAKAGAYYGVCWAGVEEFIFPIISDGMPLGFISVSGYRGNIKDAHRRIERVHAKFGLPYPLLKTQYETGLTDNVPALHEIGTVIYPLCNMLVLLFLRIPQRPTLNTKASFVYADILNYICENYTKHITLDDVAAACNYSKSYVRQLFRKKSNRTIQDYLTALRIKRAKALLANTSMRIAEIGYETGYNDPNYFTNTFKKETGQTPKQYRKSMQTDITAAPLEKFSSD